MQCWHCCTILIVFLFSVPISSDLAAREISGEINLDHFPRIVRLESSALEKIALTRIEPTLPPLPEDLKIQTTAVLELAIDQTGTVLRAKPLSVHPRLLNRAVRAARQWKFRPQSENGKPVFVLGPVTLNFRPPEPMPEPVDVAQARKEILQDPENPAGHMALAKLYERDERYEEAIGELDRVISAKPDLEEAHYVLAHIYEQMQQPEIQIEQYERYLELKPDSAEVLELLGRKYMEHKDYDEAIETLNRLLKLKPNDASVMGELGQAFSDQNQFEKAIRTYRKAVAISPDSAILHNRLGFELLRFRELKAAETELQRAISLDPDLLTSYRYLASTYYATNRYHEGIEILKKCTAKSFSNFTDPEKEFLVLGTFFIRLKKYNEAEEFLKQAIEIKSDFDDAYCALGETYALQRKNQLACETYDKGLEINQNSLCLHSRLGFLLTEMNHIDEAEVHLKKLLSLSPENPGTFLALASLMTKKRDWTEAVSLLNKALKMSPGDYRVHLSIGYIYDQMGRLDEAERELREALRFEPENPLVCNNLGYFLADHDRSLKEAADMLEVAVAADPQNASYLDSYGWAQFKLGQLDLAEKFLLSSLKVGPEHPASLEHLGDVYMKQNKPELAREQWRRAMTISESDDQSQRLRRKLGEDTQHQN